MDSTIRPKHYPEAPTRRERLGLPYPGPRRAFYQAEIRWACRILIVCLVLSTLLALGLKLNWEAVRWYLFGF